MSKILCDELGELEELKGFGDIILKYQLLDAWNMPIKCIYVSDKYVLIVDDGVKRFAYDSHKLNDILLKYSDEYESITDMVLPPSGILDGYINKLVFKVNDKVYDIDEYNLDFYSEEDINNHKYLNFIVNLYKAIYDDLISQVPEIENSFVLSDEIEEDE